MWKKILGGFGIFIVLLFVIVMYATSGLAETADKFFSALSAMHYDKAYDMLSEDFKKSVSKKKLIDFAHKNGFDLYKKANWSNRYTDGNRGVLEGSIETVRGTVVPVTLKMVQDENANWKIYAIFKPKSGIVEEGTSIKTKEDNNLKDNKPATTNSNEKPIKPTMPNPTNIPTNNINDNQSNAISNEAAANNLNSPKEMALPSDNELKRMVKKSFELLAYGIKDKNLEKLYNYMSSLVHKKFSLEQMNQHFQKEFKYADYFLELLNIEPTITKKEYVPSEKRLVIKGEYITNFNKLTYNLIYKWENNKWSLIGINFNVSDYIQNNNQQTSTNNTPPKLDTTDKYINLVKSTMHTFALSVKEKSMKKMHQQCASIFQKKIDVDKLNRLFKSFMDKNINLLLLDNLNPIFDKEPAIGSNGILELKGHYDTKPLIVRFDLKYIKEDGIWKIIGIDIDVGD